MKKLELIPTNGRKSFYGKAYVMDDEKGTEKLYSYETLILTRRNSQLQRHYNGWTQTTGAHIKAFCGLDKAGFLALPMAGDGE